jgi:hypothetical protein
VVRDDLQLVWQKPRGRNRKLGYIMKYLLEIAGVIGAKKGDGEIHEITRDHKPEIEEEVTKLAGADVGEISHRLFPAGIPVSTDFYDSLQEFQHHIGYGPAYYTLGGRLWARACSELAPDKQLVLLDSLFDKTGRGVWSVIFFLPEFCSRIEIEAQFAAGWFYRFGDEVKDDMANWDFFNGVRNYAVHFPISATKVFETYIAQQLDELKISLSALLLGTVRSQVIQGHLDRAIVDQWDERIRTSSQIDMRLIYYRSIPTSFDMGSLSAQGLNNELVAMIKGEPEEVSEAFSTVWRCMRSERADNDFMQFAMSWFSKNVSNKLPDGAKYHLVNAMWFFGTPGRQKEGIGASEADELLVAIQPIPENNRGTWERLEMYLTERLHQDTSSFESILGRLVDANPKGMIAQFQTEVFDHLKSEICKDQNQDFLTRWLLSTDVNKREIARAILQKAESAVFSSNVISKASEKQLEVALLEFMRKPLIEAEKISTYLLALEPAFRNVNMPLRQEFKNEMILQAINYPGACLYNWKKIENPSELLRDVIANAEKYFERLNVVKDSPAISFTFSGCKEASEREASEFSNKVSREAMDKSVFAKFAKNVHIIYGSRWAVMMEGKLGQATDFSQFGHSMEFPRVEIIDPEGMAIRRIQATSNIERIEGGK